MHLVVLRGHAPRGPNEIAFAPSTLRALGVHLGDEVTIGGADGTRSCGGTALLPETSHTVYDQSAWMTMGAVDTYLEANPPSGPEDVWGYALVRWQPGTQADGQRLLRKIESVGESSARRPA